MHYSLDTSFLGKVAQCSGCREKFVLERISETLTLTPIQERDSVLEEGGIDEVSPNGNASVPNTQAGIAPKTRPAEKNILKSSRELTHLHSEPTDHASPSVAVSPSEYPQTATLSVPGSPSPLDGQIGMWSVGEVILGIYEVKQLAPNLAYAQGGVGIVQRIYHREWDIDLAVKSPKPGVLRSETGVSSYERECQTWIELGLHPNIVTCYLVRRIGGIPRIFAEFIPDGSLRDWIVDLRLYKGGPKATLLRILDIAIQFAWGLDYAHRQGLLHLDIKPANVMMSGSIPKVTDFGLAQATSVNSLSPDLAVDKWEGMTPGYCSPEQYQAYLLYRRGEQNPNLKITAQSDIWSWAISVLAMFHGRAPCKKGGQTAAKVFDVFIESPAAKDRPKMPNGLIELMRRCFQENPQNRPRSMSEVAERLVQIYQETSGESYPRSIPSTTRLTAESLNNQAASLLDLNKTKEAENLFNEALKLHPWQPEVTHNQAIHLWRNGTLTDMEVLERLETLVKIRNEPVSHFSLGLVQRERGHIALARQAFETAFELKQRPDFKRALNGSEKIAPYAIRCTDRFAAKPQRGPVAFLDEKEEILLIVVDSRRFLAYEIKQARKWLTFKTTEEPVIKKSDSATTKRIALSEDFQWELFSGNTPLQLILKSVANPAKQRRLTAVPWGQLQQNVTGTFPAASWGIPQRLSPENAETTPDDTTGFFHDFNATNTASEIFNENPDPLAMSETTHTMGHNWNLLLLAKEHEIRVVDQSRNKIVGLLHGHEDEVHSISHSGRRGEWILSGSRDRTIRLWELPSCRCVRTIGGLDGSVDAVYLSRSGSFLLALIGGNSLRIWDVGILCRRSEHLRAPVLLCQISSSEELSRRQSEMAAYQEDLNNAIDRSDYATAASVVNNIRNSPGWDSVRSELPWEILMQKCLRNKPVDAVCLHTLIGHEDKITSVALSLDGRLAVSAGKDETIRLWNTQTGQCAKVLTGHQDWIRDIALTWDGRYLLSGSWDTTVRVWNTGVGKCVRILNDRIRSISRVAFHPLGKITAIATAAGSVLLWDVAADRVVGNWSAHQGGVNSISFNRDGRYLITGGDDAAICIWETASQQLIRKLVRGKLPMTAAKISANLDGCISASKEGVIEVRHLHKQVRPVLLSGHVAEITGLETIVDDRFFITASRDQTVKIWNSTNGSLQKTLSGHSGPITGLATDFSGRRLLTGSEDGTVRFWELFWDLSYPGVSDWNSNATPYLHALLSLYCNVTTAPPSLDEPTIQRILLELGYRGFGNIRPEAVRAEIQRFLTRWPGPLTFS